MTSSSPPGATLVLERHIAVPLSLVYEMYRLAQVREPDSDLLAFAQK
jgi:hypothetical protein